MTRNLARHVNGSPASAILVFGVVTLVIAIVMANRSRNAFALDTSPDVVVTDLDSLWVFPGDGDGELDEPRQLFIEACRSPDDCGEPWAVSTGDVNGDGFEDIVSGNRYGPNVSVHLGKGDGTFEEARVLATADRPYDVDLGDLDDDGDLDLVITCNNEPGPIEIRYNDGRGTFDDVVSIFPDGEPFNTELADFDDDGTLDLATTKNSGDQVAIYLNDGDGILVFERDIFVGDDPKPIKSGYFNDDDVLDIALANYDPGEISIYVGDGEGDFTFSRTYFTSGQPREIAVSDLDLDGYDDLVVATGRGTDFISVLLNTGAGGNGVFIAAERVTTGPRPNSVAATDFDDDGYPDIVVANWSLDDPPLATMSLLIGDGEGGFPQKRDFVVPGGFRKLTALAIGEFDESEPAEPFEFRRGDADIDGSINITDAVIILRFLFSGHELDCLDPADVNDNGAVQITDAILELIFLFQQGDPPAPPFPDPGPDPSDDELACNPPPAE